MSLLTFALWWATGSAILAYTAWTMLPRFTVGDVLFFLCLGFGGPVNIIFWAAYSPKPRLRKLLDKQLYPFRRP